ncbi:MAG: hypothetical protein RSG52_05340 [Terrisporobacter sp.]|uniref:hypothetical protein n=1 Tax=Terrisporobacter sp. TaxID=1965305 RepID=UPI002FC9951A
MKIHNVKIEKETVLKFLGYKNREVTPYINKVIDEEIENINNILDIEVYINEINKDIHNFSGEYVRSCFENSEKAYAVLYTIGSKIEEKILYYTNNNDMIRAMVLDKIGIVALDYVGEEIKKYLKKETDINIYCELYPGDKGFEVKNQCIIYEYVKNNNISINEYGQMTPIKSVALVVCLSSQCEKKGSRCDRCLNKCF